MLRTLARSPDERDEGLPAEARRFRILSYNVLGPWHALSTKHDLYEHTVSGEEGSLLGRKRARTVSWTGTGTGDHDPGREGDQSLVSTVLQGDRILALLVTD